MFSEVFDRRAGIRRPEFGELNLAAASWCRGLTGFVRVFKHGAIDLVSGERYTTVNGSPEYANTTQGRLVDLASGSSEYIDLGTRFKNQALPFAFAQIIQGSSVNNFSLGSRSNSSSEGIEFLIGGGGVAGTFQFRFQTSGSYNIPNAIAGNPTGAPNLLFGQIRSDGYGEFYVNNVENVTVASGASTGTITGAQNMRVGSRGTIYFTGQVGDCWFWNRDLQPTEVAAFLRDPYEPYRRSSRVFFPAAGGNTTLDLTTAALSFAPKSVQISQSVPIGSASMTVTAASLQISTLVSLAAASLSFVSRTLAIAQTIALALASGALSFAAHAVTVAQSTILQLTTATLSFVARAVTITASLSGSASFLIAIIRRRKGR